MVAKTRSAHATTGVGVGVGERVGVTRSVADADGPGPPVPADPQAEQATASRKRTAVSRLRGIVVGTPKSVIRLFDPAGRCQLQDTGRGAYDRAEMTDDAVVAELLAGPLEQFTSRRNATAKELKQAGQRERAAEVATLKKPPVAVWAVNQVARKSTAALERLRHAGEAVVRAQSGAVAGRKNAAPELRSASDGLQRELEGAVRTAGDLLRAGGHAADEATLRRVQEMLRLAAVSGGDTWERLRRGALIDEPQAGEDMLTAAFALSGGGGAQATPAKDGDRTERAAARNAAQTEKRIELEHAMRAAKLDEEAAQQAEQAARRLREEADRMAADAKRVNQKARQAAKDVERAMAKAKASREAAQRLSARPKTR